ncbi:MAG: phospholipase D-like domain-containing protein [Methyloceanibacter sp.]|uniref:phospholipase D-like domain-containing protein n=1 Tax=Methyloceanibacter sp. TaxID=1965321 RepID=UPI003D6D9A3B
MSKVTSVRAYCNNEVAYVAWAIDDKIDDCLGFEVTRVYIDERGRIIRRADGSEDRVKCASWVPFKGQRNPKWIEQDTGVWPVQKLSWRDLTLRKKRNRADRRPEDARVRYEVRPVGELKPGLEAVPSNGKEFTTEIKRDSKGNPVKGEDGKPVRTRIRAYEGKPRPLAYLAPAVASNDIHVTRTRGSFQSTFTNGILAAQWLRNVLLADGVIEPDELIKKLENPKDGHRKYLAGDVIPLIHNLFAREGEFYLALYELEDSELQDILIANASRIHVILSNTGLGKGKQWDVRNKEARRALVKAGADIQHRMFNNSIHIGHNKFVVHVPPDGGARSVFTGSTNWTSTGLAGQTNNALLIEDDKVAGVFLDYWHRMKQDVLKVPRPFGKGMNDSQQNPTFRKSNELPGEVEAADGTRITLWFSPNMPQRKKPTSKKGASVPPDLSYVYHLMRRAREAILFLAFYPGQKGNDCIIGEVIEIGRNDTTLLVTGAVSSAQAMPNYIATKKKDGVVVEEGESPSTFDEGNVSIVRAARIDDRNLLDDFGAEQLTARGGIGAIIHDKLVVIDPKSDDCHVILGSHNLGFKASYSNDENMVIVSHNRPLAEAYAVHILDVFDHYRFRAIETERARKGKKPWSGFLEKDDRWQDGYVEGRKGALIRYFAQM